ncbi:chain length determinant protein (polysaccharide antigen chain regulator) [Pseudomonas sp. 43mfcvi1.1]|jgi:chain length determinant protein (polysaccharide antigen chain regulator)|uniref:LPS O-antigen chain length determinant protein WzzB n=1 Tax=Pseudomonas TaxID=286 RepID=UPI000D6B0D5F|nr:MULTISPECIES: Wzz/FepE/Etk N-terminal domain-containing protein [Pseudomonas]AXP02130.1 chain-length determining protein [Pseudomonas fluorescens]MCD9115615.1 Wzz/FepE/Etk N-terminal domain-containing protein [Pseudomonas bijieensis]PWJ41245.1 chain length determinant protein (polysaccharide antigen chain regulator) [Pseudomonas sp. 43mfcvi1.1]UQI32751.1 Wzz/FepE/Etk N-terminal domain-containing protein [Pseudomonas bijieensis]SSB94398.1 chain length determinant protein (polysaccharide anti
MPNNRIETQSANEVDLIALARGLWGQKWLILAVTLLVTAGAAAYAYLSKPVYQAQLFIMPPTQNGIAELNYGRGKSTELDPYSIKHVYDVFARNLQGESLRQTFFNEVYLPSLDESQRTGALDRLYERFSRELVIKGAGKDTPDRYSVTVQSGDPVRATEWAKAYVARASEAAEAELIKNVTAEAAVRARNLEQRIVGLRETAQRVREDRIQQLREALKIAEAIGLTSPSINSTAAVDITVETGNKMDYQRGSKALAAEVKALESRASDDAFISDLRSLQMRYSFYRKLDIDPESISVYRQDGSVEVPQSPIKPRKALILLLGIIAGGMLGSFMALIRFAVIRSREQQLQN